MNHSHISSSLCNALYTHIKYIVDFVSLYHLMMLMFSIDDDEDDEGGNKEKKKKYLANLKIFIVYIFYNYTSSHMMTCF